MKNNLKNQILGKCFQQVFFVTELGLIVLLPNNYLIIGFISLILIFCIINLWKNGKANGQYSKNNLNILWSQIALLILLYVFQSGDRWIVIISMSTAYIAEFAAYFANHFLNVRKYKLTFEYKSVQASLVYGLGSFLILLLFGYSKNIITNAWIINIYFLIIAVLISFTIVLFEALTSKELDKFLIPLVISFFLYSFVKYPNMELLRNYLTGVLFSGVIAFLSYRVKFLTKDGALTTFLLAGFIFGLGGIKWSVPMLAFFVLSSLLSKLRKNINSNVETYFEKTGVRDYMQVLANGGIGGILVILNSIYNAEIFYIIYLASLAAVCADTWATEIGTWSKTTTYNILNFKRITQGVSGGISLRGSFGSFLGAFVIALSGFYWISFDIVTYLFLIIFAGVFGSLFDSFLGATLQAQHKCVVCDKVTEKIIHCGKTAIHFHGFSWINNDIVNLLSGFAGILIILLFKSLVNL